MAGSVCTCAEQVNVWPSPATQPGCSAVRALPTSPHRASQATGGQRTIRHGRGSQAHNPLVLSAGRAGSGATWKRKCHGCIEWPQSYQPTGHQRSADPVPVHGSAVPRAGATAWAAPTSPRERKTPSLRARPLRMPIGCSPGLHPQRQHLLLDLATLTRLRYRGLEMKGTNTTMPFESQVYGGITVEQSGPVSWEARLTSNSCVFASGYSEARAVGTLVTQLMETGHSFTLVQPREVLVEELTRACERHLHEAAAAADRLGVLDPQDSSYMWSSVSMRINDALSNVGAILASPGGDRCSGSDPSQTGTPTPRPDRTGARVILVVGYIQRSGCRCCAVCACRFHRVHDGHGVTGPFAGSCRVVSSCLLHLDHLRTARAACRVLGDQAIPAVR